MAYLCVDKNNSEWIWEDKPIRESTEFIGSCDWHHCILLNKGTIEKIIGRVLTWNDEPVEI